jgi:hypothetical protein
MDSLSQRPSQIARGTEVQQAHTPRARAIVEWIEGDLSRPPVVFAFGGSDENDDAICAEIQRRWGNQ